MIWIKSKIMGNSGVLLEQLSRPMSEKELQAVNFRKEGQVWLRKSRQIALSVLYYLEQKGMNQKDLAEKMGVTPTYVGKLLKGKENLSLETISKIEKAMGVDLVNVKRPYVKSETKSSWVVSAQSYA